MHNDIGYFSKKTEDQLLQKLAPNTVILMTVSVVLSAFTPIKVLSLNILAVITFIWAYCMGTSPKDPKGRLAAITTRMAFSLAFPLWLILFVNPPFYGLKFLFAAGALCNFAVMAANRWQVPIEGFAVIRAARKKGRKLTEVVVGAILAADSASDENSWANSKTQLKFLDDRIGHFLINNWGGDKIHICSFGDVLIWSGELITAVQIAFLFAKWVID